MIIISVLVMIVILLTTVFLAGVKYSEPGYKGRENEHFDGNRFVNPDGVKAKGFLDLLKWGLNRKQGLWEDRYETFVRSSPVPHNDDTCVLVTYVNHSTFLIQMNNINVLTDPIWSERCSPFAWAGPKRKRPPGIDINNLPEINIVTISHNHYDHLDISTVKKLEEKFKPVFIVPLGVDLYLKIQGCSKVIALDWWEISINMNLPIQLVPALHFSGRGMFDRDKTLWGGYLIGDEAFKIYFAGDTGYGSIFKEIAKKAGKIDLSILPIGAYKPEWFMSPIHISPPEAVKIHMDLNSPQSIAMHFGTFPLADEGQGEAESDLMKAIEEINLPVDEFLIPEEGKSMRFTKK